MMPPSPVVRVVVARQLTPPVGGQPSPIWPVAEAGQAPRSAPRGAPAGKGPGDVGSGVPTPPASISISAAIALRVTRPWPRPKLERPGRPDRPGPNGRGRPERPAPEQRSAELIGDQRLLVDCQLR